MSNKLSEYYKQMVLSNTLAHAEVPVSNAVLGDFEVTIGYPFWHAQHDNSYDYYSGAADWMKQSIKFLPESGAGGSSLVVAKQGVYGSARAMLVVNHRPSVTEYVLSCSQHAFQITITINNAELIDLFGQPGFDICDALAVAFSDKCYIEKASRCMHVRDFLYEAKEQAWHESFQVRTLIALGPKALAMGPSLDPLEEPKGNFPLKAAFAKASAKGLFSKRKPRKSKPAPPAPPEEKPYDQFRALENLLG